MEVCIDCGCGFEPWQDEDGDFELNSCKPCDKALAQRYEDGQLNDRDGWD